MSTIIILNGTSSAGKTTTIKALQHLADAPLLHLGCDQFFGMVPAQYKECGARAAEGLRIITSHDDCGPLAHIEVGEFGNAFWKTMPKLIKVLADDTHDVIVDEIFVDRDDLHAYVRELAHHTVYFIGVMCDLPIMMEREKLRGNRIIGQARGQHEKVHHAKQYYDLIIDTTRDSPSACAQAILDFVKNNPVPQGFVKLRT